VATWFNLRIVPDLISERSPAAPQSHSLQLTRIALFNADARPLTAMFSCVSRTRALEQIAGIGMRAFEPPRLLVYLEEPYTDPVVYPIAGPQEQDDSWVEPAVEGLKARLNRTKT
jgi:hypothetical protein